MQLQNSFAHGSEFPSSKPSIPLRSTPSNNLKSSDSFNVSSIYHLQNLTISHSSNPSDILKPPIQLSIDDFKTSDSNTIEIIPTCLNSCSDGSHSSLSSNLPDNHTHLHASVYSDTIIDPQTHPNLFSPLTIGCSCISDTSHDSSLLITCVRCQISELGSVDCTISRPNSQDCQDAQIPSTSPIDCQVLDPPFCTSPTHSSLPGSSPLNSLKDKSNLLKDRFVYTGPTSENHRAAAHLRRLEQISKYDSTNSLQYDAPALVSNCFCVIAHKRISIIKPLTTFSISTFPQNQHLPYNQAPTKYLNNQQNIAHPYPALPRSGLLQSQGLSKSKTLLKKELLDLMYSHYI